MLTRRYKSWKSYNPNIIQSCLQTVIVDTTIHKPTYHSATRSILPVQNASTPEAGISTGYMSDKVGYVQVHLTGNKAGSDGCENKVFISLLA